ncbi:Methylated-DNA--protein-cysteine methyltransferase, inducible,methylated-DNA--protein-cysteine methyltransferase,Methylated DNA-protein cysteine methyltransferase,methylated-DNA-[protein]-cysteine S-methyltransferase,6-O-methylguanine DNA methyltransferase, DNA binding domain [Chlamydia serpentis]|uniref:Methylated-DNA-[protein]-cysteine S-methyltransferase DNA binding domain-containing protein n=1 Tax=Chlamydia serpentis TaxID=1967782 RepID=A0A2R8FBN4_9CHLA|nr:methylated-DNA--[protein]-cysteine S-methyltransferase [Chlamydia serpentis]SPN73716.1 Methylated-DNA--protein-cysteine methyltransferase, inducible,methylated-DNA--protein-cysteine methyltransferase,Methylated DNA-protein cysteine methyltransferase,methylated-DNA-[protein]-cysteine S-methyltransferase,6-O-methylguanine DNA methyltransferase, DNA binding domain [Chlamydia serpentis]
MAENILIPKLMKHSLSQACSDGLLIAKYPPLQVIVHFDNNAVVKTHLSVAPVFSCLFLGAAAHTAMQEIVLWCSRYANREHPPFSSHFANNVIPEKYLKILNCVAEIPFGAQQTYAEIARKANTHPRTVGAACKQNPFLLFFPCHRVVGSNGERNYILGSRLHNILLKFEKNNYPIT